MDATDVTAPQPIVEGTPRVGVQFQPAQRTLQQDVFAIRVMMLIITVIVLVSAVAGVIMGVRLASQLDKISSGNSQLVTNSNTCDPTVMYC